MNKWHLKILLVFILLGFPTLGLADQKAISITANGEIAPKIITMGQESVACEVEGEDYVSTPVKGQISYKGTVDFDLDPSKEYVVMLYLNGNQEPLYSPVLKDKLTKWDIPTLEIQLQSEGLSSREGGMAFLYENHDGEMIDTLRSSEILKTGLVFFPLLKKDVQYSIGIEGENGKIIFSPVLKKGSNVWNLDENAPPAVQKKEDAVILSSGPTELTGVWANNGEDKVVQDELRLFSGKDVANSVWDGKTIKLFGAKNEVVAFNLILESAKKDAKDIRISFDRLEGPDGSVIISKPVRRQNIFNFIDRNIELFYVRYLQIKGLGRLLYVPDYDERHVPEKLRLPFKLPKGTSKGRFIDRPNANKFYPDIAVPLEAVGKFDISHGNNQSIWTDIYIPKSATPGIYIGSVIIEEGNENAFAVPVRLEVLPFALPDEPSAKTMVYYNNENIFDRYYGKKWPNWSDLNLGDQLRMKRVWDNHHKLAHRHKIALIDDGKSISPDLVPSMATGGIENWLKVFSGELFTKEYGYDGPWYGKTSGVYSIGTYGAWKHQWNEDNKLDMWARSNLWVNWFKKYAPNVEYFLYLFDEPGKDKFADIERWAKWIDENPGSGKELKTLVASKLPRVDKYMPSVDITFTGWGDTAVWAPVVNKYLREGKEFWAYNGWRPSSGSFETEDDGVALRVNGWIQYKHKIGRWFYWMATGYKNSSHVNLETNVFQTAWTFGRDGGYNQKYGQTGPNYSNGDGVLFYPGTEKRFPQDNYGLDGPIASLRLKHWRRGLQDVDYLTLAAQYDKEAVDALVRKMIPKVLWEVGVTNPKDPSYVHTDISWSTDPDVWEAARRQLVDIILKGMKEDNSY